MPHDHAYSRNASRDNPQKAPQNFLGVKRMFDFFSLNITFGLTFGLTNVCDRRNLVIVVIEGM